MVDLIQKAALASYGTLRSLCSAATSSIGQSTGLVYNMYSSSAGGQTPPGMTRSTLARVQYVGGDTCRIPVQHEDSKLVIYIMADSASLATIAVYPQLAIRLPNHASTIQDMSPAWGIGNTVGSSTEESGWHLVKATAACIATSTQTEAFIAGPFESAKYAMNFGGTSTGGGSTLGNAAASAPHFIEKNQNYFEVQLQYSSVLSTGTWLKNTTNTLSTDGAIYYLPIELP